MMISLALLTGILFRLSESTPGNTVFDNGTISFAPVPTSTGGFSPSVYDARGLDGYYAMANGFVDAVRSGSLPYDEVIFPLLRDYYASVQSPNSQSSTPNSDEIFQNVVSWYGGIIAVTVLGFVLAFCMPLACLIVCCCRLCNQCGGNLSWSVEEEEKEKKKRICCIVLLAFALIFLALVFVGMVLAFLTNEAIQDTVENVVPTVLNTVDNVGAFTTDALNLTSFLIVDQFNFTVNLVVDEVAESSGRVAEPLVGIAQPAVNRFLDVVLSINDSINSAFDNLTDIFTIMLDANESNISDATIRSELENLENECLELPLFFPPLRLPCLAAVEFVDIDSTSEVNFISLLDDAQNTINGLRGRLLEGLDSAIEVVNNTANNIPSIVEDAVGNGIRRISMPVFASLSDGFESAGEALNDVLTGPDSLPQLIRDDNVAGTVQGLSVARYVFGLLFCILIILVIVAVSLGLICGVAGFRNDRLPYERTSLSNCGGICLLVSAALIFLAGFILLILAAIMFPFGSTLRKFCLAVQDPEYEVYGRVLDNTEIWGDPPLGNLVSQVTNNPTLSSLDINVQSVFRNCEQNQPLYEAVNGDELEVAILGQMITLSQLQNDPIAILNMFNFTVDNAIGRVNNVLETAMPVETLRQLADSIPEVSVFNFSVLFDEIRTPIRQLNETLESVRVGAEVVRNLSIDFPFFNLSSIVALADGILSTVDATQSLLNTFLNLLNEVEAAAVQAQMVVVGAIETARLGADEVITDVEEGIMSINSTIISVVNETLNSDTIQFVTQYGNYVLDSLRNALRCGPLSNAYVEAMNLICRQTVNSMNGFWFSMGWCALFFIPLVAFVIALSKCFRRHKEVASKSKVPNENPGYQLDMYHNPTIVTINQTIGGDGDWTKENFPTAAF